jgi:hypothetical protein
MNSTINTKLRRWYQFSLRTMLIVMVLASAAFGYWVHWSREWIRQRHEAIVEPGVYSIAIEAEQDRPYAPGGLWLFAEKGEAEIECNTSKREWVQRLFPEASVSGLGFEKPE